MPKIIFKISIILLTFFATILIARAETDQFELSNDPCGDLFNSISNNIQTLQNAPGLSRQYYGFSIEPAFIDGHELDGVSSKDEVENFLIVTEVPNQNDNTYYMMDENNVYQSYIKSESSTGSVYKTDGLMVGDLIYEINGLKVNSNNFYDAWQNLYLYYGKNYSFTEYGR